MKPLNVNPSNPIQRLRLLCSCFLFSRALEKKAFSCSTDLTPTNLFLFSMQSAAAAHLRLSYPAAWHCSTAIRYNALHWDRPLK